MDLREQLQATYDKLSAEAAPEPAAAVEADPAPAAGDEGAPAIEPADPAPEGSAQPRDATGKFAPKTQDAAAPAGADASATPPAATNESETAKPAEKEPQSEAIPIPPSLPAAVKAQWSELKPEVQTAFRKLEDSVQTAKAEWGRKGERLNRYDEIIGPHLDRWRLGGLDEFSGIQALISAQNILERNPVEGLAHIARSYGVDLRALAGQALQQPTGAEGQPAPTVPPGLDAALRPLVQQVQTLQQQWQQSQQQSEQRSQDSALAEVQAFASDRANMYFENVRNDVANILRAAAAANQEITLKEAYDRAIWASPEIRPLLLAERAKASQAAAQAKAQEQAARTKAAAAQQAAGSVTGAPAPGAQPPAGPVGSIRETLEAAAREVGYRA